MKILITGAAGFIGFHLSKKMTELGHQVVGLDNINNYYDTELKFSRLEILGVSKEFARINNITAKSSLYQNFKFLRLSLEDHKNLDLLFEQEQFDIVCNLAAQAGVRYSLENPKAYIDSNIVGFSNILECSRKHKIKHLIYASSSSVYGNNTKVPFETSDNVDSPISLYAATKKSNELMAHTYSHLYQLPTTGLRFFTVYGPWGRPDMAMFLFVDAIIKNRPIDVFNHGNMERDFTFVDDIVGGITRIMIADDSKRILSKDFYRLYNIGNNSSVKLMKFIEAIENKLGIQAEKNFMPLQAGDVEKTWANVDGLVQDYGYAPNTSISVGVSRFIDWYKDFYNIKS